MICPICASEMQQGGLIADGIFVSWFPQEEFEKKNLLGIHFDGKILDGHSNYILKQTKVPNAFYCETCNKVVGIFELE